MNQEAWDSLNSKVAQRDELQGQADQLEQQLSQLKGEIEELAGSLQDELGQYRASKSATAGLTTETDATTIE